MPDVTPRLVHLVWLGSAVPARVEQLRDDIARHDPDVEVRVWTDADLGGLRNAEELRAESRMSGKANIARYELLLQYGGLYLDADFRIHRSLVDVFSATDTHGLVVARQSRVVYNPAFIAAVPGHAALRRAVEGIPASRLRFAAMTSPARTGPHYFTSILLDHVREGGAFGELPQHAVFPWYSDEDALPPAHLPASIIMSHEWATAGGRWSWRELEAAPDVVRIPDRRTRMRRNGGTLRARAATTPGVHRLVTAAERVRDRDWHAGREHEAGGPRGASTAVLEGWTAREARRRLRGSAAFLDLHPASWEPALAAAEALDRPGRTIVVRAIDAAAPPLTWTDRSTRCSVHDAMIDTSRDDRVVRIRSLGAPLVTRTVSPGAPPLDHEVEPSGLTAADLIEAMPRLDLVRTCGERLTLPVAEALHRMAMCRRLAHLLITIDPMSVTAGTDVAVELLAALEADGARLTIGPWLIDGRGRTWREQLRGAARPFIIAIDNAP